MRSVLTNTVLGVAVTIPLLVLLLLTELASLGQRDGQRLRFRRARVVVGAVLVIVLLSVIGLRFEYAR